jgi:hypothetical protein
MSGIQYTIRGVPEELDTVLRQEAAEYGKSLNSLLIDKIAESCKLQQIPRTNGLEKFAGTWIDDPEFDEAMKDHDIVHPQEWV